MSHRDPAWLRNAFIVGVSVLAGAALLVALFGGPAVRLRLARLTGVARFQVKSVISTGAGVLVAEGIELQRGGIARVCLLGADGSVRSRVFDRELRIVGITGDLAWLSSNDLPSLRLPSLEDGPARAEVVAGCGLRPISVSVGDGVLLVQTEDGEVHECRPPAEHLESSQEADEPASPPPFLLTQGSRQTGLTLEGATIAERLFDARLFRPRGVGGDAVVVFGQSLAADTTLVAARFGVEGERWRTDLRTPEVRFVRTIEHRVVADDSRVTSLGDRIVVLGNDASGSVGAIALGKDDGQVRWARLIE